MQTEQPQSKPIDTRTLCPLAWNHFSVNLDTSMRICCNTHNGGNVYDSAGNMVNLRDVKDLEGYYNSDFYRHLRKLMMSGQRHEHCHNCYTMEDHGAFSLRQIYLDRFSRDPEFIRQLQETTPEGDIKPRVTYLDFSLGNKCNLKCVMCNPTASTILGREFDELGWFYDKNYFNNAENGWKDEDSILRTVELCLPTIQEMLFTGGEPLISNLHMKILEKAVVMGYSKKIVLRYHSNCTNIPARMLQIWPHFKHLELHCSIEGVGPMNDYIRFGSTFKVIEENVIKVADLPNSFVEIHTCFQIPTILNLPDLHKWTANLHPRVPELPYHIWVNHPDWLEAYNLSDDLKKLARSRIEASLASINSTRWKGWVDSQKTHVMSLLSRMESKRSNPSKWHEFKHKISELETLRGNSLKELAPELFA